MKRTSLLILACWLAFLSITVADDFSGSLALKNAEVKQVLAIYKSLSGLELVVDSRVKDVRSPVTLPSASSHSKADTLKLIEKTLLEQTGVVITHLDDQRASVTYNDALPITKAK